MLQRKWGYVGGEKNILPLPKEAKREALEQKDQVKLSPYNPGKKQENKNAKKQNLKNKRQSKNLALPQKCAEMQIKLDKITAF